MNKQQPLILFYRQRNCLWWRGFEFSAIARVALDVRLGCLQDVPAEPDTQQLIDAVNTFFTNVGILELKPPFWKIIPTPRWRAYIRALDQISRWVCIADPGKIFQQQVEGLFFVLFATELCEAPLTALWSTCDRAFLSFLSQITRRWVMLRIALEEKNECARAWHNRPAGQWNSERPYVKTVSTRLNIVRIHSQFFFKFTSHCERKGYLPWAVMSNKVHILASLLGTFGKKRIRTRWLYNGVITPVENGRRFLTPLVCAGCLLKGWQAAFARAERSRTPLDLPEQAAFHPVSRQSA